MAPEEETDTLQVGRNTYGNQANRFTAFTKGTGGLFHPNSSHRSYYPGPRALARHCRMHDIRAHRPLRMAQAPARTNLDRDIRPWLDPVLGWSDRGNPAR